MKVFLVRIHVYEPIWLIIRARNKQHCEEFIEQWKNSGKWSKYRKNYTHTIKLCKDGEGIILIEEY